jgi:hypothetical protein
VVEPLAKEPRASLQEPVVMEVMACQAWGVDQQVVVRAFQALEATGLREHFVICSFSSGASAHL